MLIIFFVLLGIVFIGIAAWSSPSHFTLLALKRNLIFIAISSAFAVILPLPFLDPIRRYLLRAPGTAVHEPVRHLLDHVDQVETAQDQYLGQGQAWSVCVFWGERDRGRG